MKKLNFSKGSADDGRCGKKKFRISLSKTEIHSILKGENYASSSYHPSDYDRWKSQFANEYSRRQPPGSKYWSKRNFAIDYLFEWSLRLKSQQNIPRKILQLSVFLYQHCCPKPIWNILSKLRIVLSYNKTRDIIKESRDLNIAKILGWQRHESVMVIGADNCSYFNGTSLARDSNAPVFIHSVNYYERLWKSPPEVRIRDDDDIYPQEYYQNEELFR